MSNSFGNLFKITSFGESHGDGLGVVIDGMPSGVVFDSELLADDLGRRKPGGDFVSKRKESDIPRILSGVYQGKTLGTPVSCVFENVDARSQDYDQMKARRGHADHAWLTKYNHVDPRGGGRSSGRETLARVVGGAFAKMALKATFPEIQVKAVTKSIYKFVDEDYDDKSFFKSVTSQLGFLSHELSAKAEDALLKAQKEGDSFGGKIELRVLSCPESLGQPVFGKIKSKLAEAILSIGAVKSFSLGEDVDFSKVTGKVYHNMDKSIYGGVQGGITTGETIKVTVEVKPTSSILDVAKSGRHDPSIVPRVLVVLESMVWIVLMDMWLHRKTEV